MDYESDAEEDDQNIMSPLSSRKVQRLSLSQTVRKFHGFLLLCFFRNLHVILRLTRKERSVVKMKLMSLSQCFL